MINWTAWIRHQKPAERKTESGPYPDACEAIERNSEALRAKREGFRRRNVVPMKRRVEK